MPNHEPKITDPIKAWFVPRNLSRKFETEEKVRQIEDVPMPLRYDRDAEAPDPSRITLHNKELSTGTTPDAVHILFVDAIKAYKIFGRPAVAEMFAQIQAANDHTDVLIFGGPTPPTVFTSEALGLMLPGIEDFDSIEI